MKMIPSTQFTVKLREKINLKAIKNVDKIMGNFNEENVK